MRPSVKPYSASDLMPVTAFTGIKTYSVERRVEKNRTVTITRNPIIASMFFRIDYIEQMGTGIGRMRNATREANVAEPEFEFAGFFKVTFKRSEAESSIGRQSAANRSLSVAATDRKSAVVSYLEENGQARVADFAGVIGLSDSRVRALLREMVGDGRIEKIGDKRYAHYVLKS